MPPPLSFDHLSTGYRLLDILFSIVIAFCVTVGSTYCITSIRFIVSKRSYGASTKGKEPPTLPYWLPFVGHMFQMADLHGLYDLAA